MEFLSPFAVLAEEDGMGPISHLAFSREGLLAVGCGGRVLLWDLSRKAIPEDPLLACGAAYMPSLAWSPDGSRLAVGQEKGVAIYYS